MEPSLSDVGRGELSTSLTPSLPTLPLVLPSPFSPLDQSRKGTARVRVGTSAPESPESYIETTLERGLV